jgi:hypothetical protein
LTFSPSRADPDLIAPITAWVTDGRPGLADLGYEGAPDVVAVPYKKPMTAGLTVEQQTFTAEHGALRCLG